MKIDQEPFAQAHDVFYDNDIAILTPTTTTDDIGYAKTTWAVDRNATVNVQPTTSQIMQRDFGKDVVADFRVSCPLAVGILKENKIRYNGEDYDIVALQNYETYQVAGIRKASVSHG